MHTLLHHSIDRAAEVQPSREAFRFHDQSLTYEELVHRANQLAHLLIKQGIRPMDRVGIYLPKCLESSIAIYGILKAGAAYVTIDPSAPLDRIRFILKDCQICHLITSSAKKKMLKALLNEATSLRTLVGVSSEILEKKTVACYSWSSLLSGTETAPDVQIKEQDLAYIMYTSGSTGVPKGLMHTHYSGLSYARYSAHTYDVQLGDRLGNHSHLHFDISTFEYLTGPYSGATTVIIPEESMYFPLSLAELIERERLTFLYSVPLALIQLIDQEDLEQRDMSSLRWVLFGGEPFSPKHLNRLMKLWPYTKFSNVYGPAEVNQCTYYHVPERALDDEEPIPLGRIWDGAEGRIIDEGDREIGAGKIGELIIRSSTMMQGYWGRPDLNESSFYEESLYGGFKKLFYRTGDMVSMDSTGKLHFHGRKDRQIKIRGYRLELDEVEHVLNTLSGVKESAVFSVATSDEQTKLVAILLLESGIRLDEEGVQGWMREKMPSYSIPESIKFQSSLPRTTSGKVDRGALKEMFLSDENKHLKVHSTSHKNKWR